MLGALPQTPFSAKPARKAARFSDMSIFIDWCRVKATRSTQAVFPRLLCAPAALRMEKLADCETTLLRAMPFVPLYFDTWVYLERPEVRGLSVGPMGYPAFKYAWIDTNRSRS